MSIELENTAADPDAANRPTALAPGAQLGKYQLERILGEGGMGVVWAARDPDLQRSVALKVIKYATASTMLRQRLLREAVAMAKLKHPNVLTVYEVGTVGDRDYIAMELVDGTTLDAWLEHRPPRELVWNAILAAGRGLAAAHEAGVVHRDFKPHNVLRSRDGRVLVTDFGLARGILAEDESAATEAEDRAVPDSVLDTPLTQTGALIGTPAYMAPEQYQGAAPDPRTDQFAFCVTAWQAFTGDRPFKGSTLDEMRKAVSSGVAHLTSAPERAIRAVLARGLDPKPEARWPSLEDLLDALVRAERAPRRRKISFAVIVGVLLTAMSVTWLTLRRDGTVANACDAPEREFASAWSPAVRSALQRSANTLAFDKVASAFDQFQERWITSYLKACRTRNAKSFPVRVRCLESMRDQISTLTVFLQNAPAQMLERFDAPGLFPQLAMCERANPQFVAALPTQEPQRGQVHAIFSKSMLLAAAPLETVETVGAQLEKDAAATGWKPALGFVIVMTADIYMRYGEIAKARATYQRALAAAKDSRLEGRVRLGLLDTWMIELTNPEAKITPRFDDPRAQPVLHPELATALTVARDAVNDDALLRGALEMTAATAYMQLAQWNRYRTAYADALAHVQEARKLFESLQDVRRAAQASALEGEIYLARGDDRALDDALFAARRAADSLAAADVPTLPELDEVLRRVAFARPDYNEVHRIADRRIAHEVSPAKTTITGRVSPPQRAMVIAWRGELAGDPRRAYIDATAEAIASPGFAGARSSDAESIDIVQAADDGSFTLHAEPGWAVIAELADARSLPQVIGSGPLALTLRPTVTQSGTVSGKNLLGVRAFAEYAVGTSSWALHVPVQRDGTFDLRGMPTGGTPAFGTTGEAGHGTRTVRAATANALTWPFGQALEVIVRTKQPNLPVTVRVTAGKLDTVVADVRPIGASNTDAGREHYRAGDRHAVITGNRAEPLTVCANDACRVVTLQPSVVIENPDGRYAAGVTPIVVEL